MSRDLINLLPRERVRKFRRTYFLRVGTVALVLLTVLVVIHSIFLLPSYIAAESAVNVEQVELAGALAAVASSSSDAAAELTMLKADTSYLSRLGTAPSASAAVRAVLSVSHPGLVIQNISYQPPTPADPASAKILLTGVAASREQLSAYDLALTNAPFITSVDLPISAYAAETNISFSVTVTGTLMP
jgi:hypothetical protein